MKNRLFVVGLTSLLVLGGCASQTSHFSVNDKAASVPRWITESERVISLAAASPGAAICPDKIARAYKYAAHAMETYWACNDANAKSLLRDAERFAAEAVACTRQVETGVPVERASAGPVTLSANTLFAFDRSNLSPQGIDRLNRFLQELANIPYDGVMIVGHTDPIGEEKYNQGLSERRARAVADYLVSQGIPWSRIRTEGRGERELVVTYQECANQGGQDHSAVLQCLQPNRRAVTSVRVSADVYEGLERASQGTVQH